MTEHEKIDGDTGSDKLHNAAPNHALRAVVIVLLSTLVGVGIWLWEENEDRIVPRNAATVVEGEVYRSGRLTKQTMNQMYKKHELKTIVDLGAYPLGSELRQELRDSAEALGINRIEIDLHGDGTGNPNGFADVVRLMADESNHPILVHCAAGSERTGASVALYRHIVQGVPLEEAMIEGLSRKHNPSGNPRMFSFVAEWHEEIAEAVRTDGWIEGYPTRDQEGWSLQRLPNDPQNAE